MSGITNPFATNYAKPWEMDAALAQIEHNKLVGQDLRSQIAEREANRTALSNLDFGGAPGGGTGTAATGGTGGTAPAAPRTAYGAGGPGASITVPPEYLPYYAEAEKLTGIPQAILIAQHRQESGFNPGATGTSGEIGIGQIMPSTARAPGYGVTPIANPDQLRDPRTNILFAAQYLKGRGGANVDWSNPAQAALALQRYNGGGDPNYVANVTRYLPAAQGATQQATAAPQAPGGVAARTGGTDVAGPGGGRVVPPAIGAAARQLLAMPEDQAAAAYPRVLQELRAAGVDMPNAPATYPGHAAVQKIVDGLGVQAPVPPPKDPATMTDAEWLDWQAQTYPGLAGPNANPTAAPLNALAPAQAPTPPAPAAPAAPAVPQAPTAPAAPQAAPTVPTVPTPTPPPAVNNLGLTADDQQTLRTMATSKGQTPATIAAAMTQMRAHNQALAAQYRTDLEQAGNTAYTRSHQAQVDAATAEERRQAALRQGLPPGWHIGPDGKPEQIPEVKAAEGAKGPFPGQAEPAQLRNTLLTADPKSPEFHAAWEAYANPHEANGVLIQGHNMEPFKLPMDAEGNPVTTYAKPPMAIGPGDLTQLRKIETEAGSLTSALDEFAKVSREATVTEKAKTLAGASTDLRSAWTNAALMAKGEALFNLGVLSGPDMTVIRGALADPSTFFGASATQETIDKQVGRIKRLLQTRLDQARQSYAPGVSRGTPDAKPDAPATRPPLSSFGR